LSISPSAVSRYANRACQLGITDWPLTAKWDDISLSRAFHQTKVKTKINAIPDWSQLYQERKHKTVTLQLLGEEYIERHPAGHYSYTHFCRLYKAGLKCQKPSMRQQHKAGKKRFVD